MMDGTGPGAQIRSASERLDRALQPIEQVFSQAGMLLGGGVEALRRLTGDFAAMGQRMDDAEAEAALAKLDTVARRIGGLSDSTQASHDRLVALQEQATALGARIDRLRKVIGEIGVLAINAKVEAAHVSAPDVDFTVFTREIGRLAQLAGEGLNRLGDELSGLLGHMQGARSGLDSFNRDHRQSLAAVAGGLAEGLADASRHRQDSARTVRELGELSGQMAVKVSQVVEALQVGDITRQRAQHIREALATLVEVLDSDDRAMSQDHRLVLTATVCQLQAAQARHSSDDLRRELTRINDSIRGLMADVAELPARCADTTGAAGDRRGSFLAVLGRRLEGAHDLLRRFAEARHGMDEVVREISGTVAGMVSHVESVSSIEADMRVMGLNATFKCGRLGDQGRALSVIAQELRNYSNRTAEDGRAIMEGLNRLIEDAREMGERERQGDEAGHMESDMAAAVQVLEDIGDELSRRLTALGQDGTAVNLALSRSLEVFGRAPGLPEALAECAGSLEKLTSLGKGSVRDLENIRGEVLNLLRGRYTMASERKVHDLFGTAPEPAAGSAGKSGVDGLLF